MGSIQSFVPSELTLAALIAAGVLAFGYVHLNKSETSSQPAVTISEKKSLKELKKSASTATIGAAGKKKETATERLSRSLQPPSGVPGGFGTDTASASEAPSVGSTKQTKKPKKKAKKAAPVEATTPVAVVQQSGPSSTAGAGRSARQPQLVDDDDEMWTRVESRKKSKGKAANTPGAAENKVAEGSITTSVTGASSTDEEELNRTPAIEPPKATGNKKTLAEKMLPKARKTPVDDMLDDGQSTSISRVMRVQPQVGEQPAAGYSWADYEDVHVTADDADGEDDGGWGVVRRSKPRQQRPQEASETTATGSGTESKKQRQNAAKRDAQKAAKADAEAERLATLAKHKRELEKARIAEQYSKSSKKPNAAASIDDNGHLVWD